MYFKPNQHLVLIIYKKKLTINSEVDDLQHVPLNPVYKRADSGVHSRFVKLTAGRRSVTDDAGQFPTSWWRVCVRCDQRLAAVTGAFNKMKQENFIKSLLIIVNLSYQESSPESPSAHICDGPITFPSSAYMFWQFWFAIPFSSAFNLMLLLLAASVFPNPETSIWRSLKFFPMFEGKQTGFTNLLNVTGLSKIKIAISLCWSLLLGVKLSWIITRLTPKSTASGAQILWIANGPSQSGFVWRFHSPSRTLCNCLCFCKRISGWTQCAAEIIWIQLEVLKNKCWWVNLWELIFDLSKHRHRNIRQSPHFHFELFLLWVTLVNPKESSLAKVHCT